MTGEDGGGNRGNEKLRKEQLKRRRSRRRRRGGRGKYKHGRLCLRGYLRDEGRKGAFMACEMGRRVCF